MPRAYIEVILSSNPGKRRWYLAISCGSKLAWRSHGTASSIRPVSVRTVFLPSPLRRAIAPVARLVAGQVMVYLGIENPFGQGLFSIHQAGHGDQRRFSG